MRKIFIIDTSVLLYDKCSIHSFPENDVVIPLVVLDELDRFKDKKGIVGENARYVNRYLDDLRRLGNLHEGVSVENDQNIRVEINLGPIPDGLNPAWADNRIISCAIRLSGENEKSKVVVITKDINFRVKCDALGIKSEDYYKDRISTNSDGLYKGYKDIIIPSSTFINKSYESGTVEIKDLEEYGYFNDLNQNEFVCLKNESQSFLGIVKNDKIEKILQPEHLGLDFVGVKPKNREQLYALNLLVKDNIPLVSITGIAGSGKTYLTIMAGLEGIQTGRYDRIVITRNIQPVGRDIGFLPGDADEKMWPWISPIIDNFRQGLRDDDLTYFKGLKSKGKIEIAPLSFMRGRTFSNTFMILDEAQNATIHELKTVITRIGENSKLVLLGDIEQIDTPYIDALSNGLTIVSEKFKSEKLAGHVTLKKGERSKLSALASKII